MPVAMALSSSRSTTTTRPSYARRFMKMFPEHEGFFRTREQTSEGRARYPSARTYASRLWGCLMARNMEWYDEERNRELSNLCDDLWTVEMVPIYRH